MIRFIAFIFILVSTPTFASNEIQDAKQGVRESLKDASSAKFRNVKFHKDSGIVCGEVNAKNSYGGYSGYQYFISIGGNPIMDVHPELYNKKCK